MQEKNRNLRSLSFASFQDVPGATPRRRRSTWLLNPLRDEIVGEVADAARRLVGEDEVLKALGRRVE